MYAKVFLQIYDGTLCTKGPWQALVTFQQLLVLADKNGVVDMTPEAISRRTTIPQDIINIGITALLQEDHGSRSPAELGRRIIPLSPDRSWGWLIVNYVEYRNLKREEDRREYHRMYWHKRKKTQHTQLNQPIAEAYAKEYISSISDSEKNPSPLSTVPVDVHATSFQKFWDSYPRKDAKKKSQSAWKTKKLHKQLTAILADIKRRMNSGDWVDAKYIPIATTYLNGERWKDGGDVKREFSPYDNII